MCLLNRQPFYVNFPFKCVLNKLTMIFQNRWSNVFCGIVSRARTVEVLSTGVAGTYNGAMQAVRGSII